MDDQAALALPADDPRHLLAECRIFDKGQREALLVQVGVLLTAARRQAQRSLQTATRYGATPADLANHEGDTRAAWLLHCAMSALGSDGYQL